MCDYTITLQNSTDEAQIDKLLDLTFGVERKSRPSYSFRTDVSAVPDLSFSVRAPSSGKLLGTLRFWPVLVGDETALLLGPLAVQPDLQGKGIGKALVKHGLNKARKMGYRLCFVVGEHLYYAPYGFDLAKPLGFEMPVPVSADKFQVLSLQNMPFGILPKGELVPWENTYEERVIQKV
ncbi:GNAT family N-acetyltransferase [uncultured Kiloniella sp.]|uniref:GNAT family N-acetyltransferase n=1 Tax=uncultured Kiloniella sp. TaxID=1133091 RepID=UPI00262A2F25|nr:N-acetyltransferase [uncultured Kiloniella sp.]